MALGPGAQFIDGRVRSVDGTPINPRKEDGHGSGASNLSHHLPYGVQPDGDEVPQRATGLAGSHIIPLEAGGDASIGIFDTDGWDSADLIIISDKPSAIDGVRVIYYEEATDPNSSRFIDPYTFSEQDVAIGHRVIPITLPFDGVSVEYENNPNAAQTRFEMYLTLRRDMPLPNNKAFRTPIFLRDRATLTRGTLEATAGGENDDIEAIGRDGSGPALNTHIKGISQAVRIGSLDDWDVFQRTVGSDQAVRLDTPVIPNREGVEVFNYGQHVILVKPVDTVSEDNARPIFPGGHFYIRAGPDSQVWGICEDAGGSSQTVKEDGATAAGTATDPSNALTSDDARTVQDTVGQIIEVDGYVFAHAAGFTSIESVRLGIEARKSPTPATQTVAFDGPAVTATAGNVGSISSGTVTAVEGHTYIIAVSRKNTNAQVTGVTGLGATVTKVADSTGVDAALSVYLATGAQTDGEFTANFSQQATNCVMHVLPFSGADGLEASDILTGTSTGYSGSVTGTDRGMLVALAAFTNQTHTAGSGSTEQAESTVGSGANAASLASSTRALTATGSAPYSGTFTASVGWAAIGLTLIPADTTPPTTTLSYEYSGTPGNTSGLVSVPSQIDVTQFVDISADREWMADDIANVKVISTLESVGAAPFETDHLFIEVRETSGATTRVAISQTGNPPPGGA